MISIKRILCPIDFSEHSRDALNAAVAMARAFEARLIALHVFTSWPAVDAIPPLANDARSSKAVDADAIRRVLEDFTRPAAERVDLIARVDEAADAHRQILAAADSSKADLLVLGTHGRSGFERAVLGSITEKLLRKARCPVMVVPRPGEKSDLGGAVHFRRVLCGVDFSTGSERALTYAMSMARRAAGQLTLLHVVEAAPGLFEGDGVDLRAFRVATEGARARLSTLIPDSLRSLCVVDTVVSEGRPSQEILRVAAERKTDLILMGVEGRGAIERMMFGSNTDRVIRQAACPVLAVPAQSPD
jgi:nucleotide-binding universal stress UspA family protein